MLTTGYVFEIDHSTFGILVYTTTGPRVFCAFLPDAGSVPGAISAMAGRFAGKFLVADADQTAWGKRVGAAKMFTPLF